MLVLGPKNKRKSNVRSVKFLLLIGQIMRVFQIDHLKLQPICYKKPKNHTSGEGGAMEGGMLNNAYSNHWVGMRLIEIMLGYSYVE
jgi:hypothetical protein